jgi:hypothetical protein
VANTEIVVAWSRNRRLHLVAPQGLVGRVDEAALRKAIPRLDDLDGVADAVARIVGRPVRVRAWEPPTSDFYLDIEASHG